MTPSDLRALCALQNNRKKPKPMLADSDFRARETFEEREENDGSGGVEVNSGHPIVDAFSTWRVGVDIKHQTCRQRAANDDRTTGRPLS